MSGKDAHFLSEVAAANVRRWRRVRGLDQQGLADRLAELGWPTDRTTVTRIETGARKIGLDDLGRLALALNVPLTVLLLPVHETISVTLANTPPIHPWLLWEWMLGNEPLPGRHAAARLTNEGVAFPADLPPWIDEWTSGAEPLRLYERVQIAQLELADFEKDGALTGKRFVAALQQLVDTVADMEDAGLPAADLIADGWRKLIAEHRLERSPRRRRYASVKLADAARNPS